MLLDHGIISEMFHTYALPLFMGFGGVLCNILYKLKGIQELRKNFSFVYWLNHNWVGTLLSFVALPFAIFLLGSMDQLNEAVALLAGWGIDNIIKDWNK